MNVRIEMDMNRPVNSTKVANLKDCFACSDEMTNLETNSFNYSFLEYLNIGIHLEFGARSSELIQN